MSDQLSDREDLVKKLFNTSDMAQIRRILIEESIAKMVEPTMTDGERIANKNVVVHDRRIVSIAGSFVQAGYQISDNAEALRDQLRGCISRMIDAALAAQTEAAAKIVEMAIWNGREFQGITAAIRKLGEAK